MKQFIAIPWYFVKGFFLSNSTNIFNSPTLKDLIEKNKEVTLKVESVPHFKQMLEYLYSGVRKKIFSNFFFFRCLNSQMIIIWKF